VGAVTAQDKPDEQTGLFADRYEHCFVLAYQAAYRVLGDRADAEDIAQESLTRAYVRWRKIAAYAEPWVVRVATNLAIDVARARTRRRPSATAEPDATAAVDSRVDLVVAIGNLPRRQREVVSLRYIADMSEIDVAALLRCSTGTVKQHASRGLAALRRSGHLTEEDA